MPTTRIIPSAIDKILQPFAAAFTRPTARRFLLLAMGLILTFGRRTVTAVLWTLRGMAPGHSSTYHRIFSRAVWSLWQLGKILTWLILATVPSGESILVAVDDTTTQHRGKKVYGKGCHHDAVRSTHTHLVWRWGHRWVVLAILVKFPFAHRPWALPVLVALYKPEKLNRSEKHRHKTAIVLARQLLATLIHWFPDRHFIVLGDGGYASHDLARFCYRHRRQLTLISRFYPKAGLYEPPPSGPRIGRPRVKGRKLPTPQEAVARRCPTAATVSWYGGESRRIEFVSGSGHWYRGGQGLVPVRWVFVHDVQGTHRDEYFYTTDPALAAPRIVSLYTARWSLETTFQELRTHLGFETTKQWVKTSVLRTGPVLLGLFSVVSLIFAEHVRHHRLPIRQTAWYTKTEPTFSDALATVRWLVWRELLFQHPRFHNPVQKLPDKLKNFLLDRLSGAA
jgi:hypothetical protein